MQRELPRPVVTEADPSARPAARDAAVSEGPVLVIRHGAFGDLLQADGALRDLREHHRDRRIVLLASSPYTRLMARCPYVDEVIPDPRAPLLQLGRNLALLRSLRERGFERVYDLQGSDRTALYRRLMPEPAHWLRKHNPADSGTPDRLAYAWMLAQAGIPVRHADAPDPVWMADDASGLLAAAGVPSDYIVLIPGSAARHVHKRWPGHAELARRLVELGHAVVGVPGPGELELAPSLPRTARAPFWPLPGARPSPRSMRPGNSASSVPNCSAITSGAWLGSMIPPAPTRMVEVAAPTCAITTAVAALAIPGMP